LGKERRKLAPELEEVKLQVAQANRVLSDVGLATGVTLALGHASMRVPSQPDRFVVKGRQYYLDGLAVMRAEDMVVCDTEGFLVDGPSGITQCSEVKIHSCIYKTRHDVQSVVHVHPRFTVLLSVLRIPLVPMCQEGIQLVRNPLHTLSHFQGVLQGRAPQRDGIWNYRVSRVSRDL
jgi:ribulose-5-phosphate 4-epimerase/fuculose-1-phosphate aldolase